MNHSPEFDAWVEGARAVNVRDAIQYLPVPMRGLYKTTEGLEGPCPVCGGTDRFGMNFKKNLFFCRQCATGGDAIELIKFAGGLGFVSAVELLTGQAAPKGTARDYAPEPDMSRVRERRADERVKDDQEAETKANQLAKSVNAAHDLFKASKPFIGSLAETYLKARKIILTPEMAVDLRCCPSLEYKGFADKDAAQPTNLGSFPAMLAAIRDVDGQFIGLHRTYLAMDGSAKLTPPGDARRNNAKKVWGQQKHGHIRLGPILSSMVMGEGIETTASWFQLGMGPGMIGAMVSVNLDNMNGIATGSVPHPETDKKTIPNGVPDPEKPGVQMPAGVQELILLGDGDSDFHVTRAKLLCGARRYQQQDIQTSVHFAPKDEDFNDVLRRNGASKLEPILTCAEYEAQVQPLLYPVPEFKSRYGALSWRDLDKPGPEMEWLVDGLMTTRDKSIIAGPTQSGKSFLAISVGMAIARGVPVFEYETQQGLVIYQAGEGALGVKKRLRAYRKHFNVSSDQDLPFVLLQSRVDLFSEEGDTKGLIEEITAIRAMYNVPLKAIFIDTLATAQGIADENSGKDMGRVIENIDKIRNATDAHVCLVHHLNADGNKLRGHTSITANIDQVLAVTCDKETKIRTVRTSKMKDGDDTTTFRFELMSVNLGRDMRDRDITSCVALPIGEKEALRSFDGPKPFVANDTEKKVMRALFAALKAHGELPSSEMRVGSNVRKVVAYEHVKVEFSRLDLRDDEDPEKGRARQKTALKRARERLESAGAIGVDSPFVWFSGRPVSGVVETYPPRPRQQKDLPQLVDADIPF